MQISLVIPILNEEKSIRLLINSVLGQTRIPDEIVFVDGGSTDKTIEILEQLAVEDSRYKIIKTSRSSPGKGRNIGIENAKFDWIALTDAGIEIHSKWLECLEAKQKSEPSADLIYGNYSPMTNTFFEKCAALSYVLPLQKNFIRGKSVASLLMKKLVWESVGGFPDLRAAEDLMFMEAAESKNFNLAFAPDAMVYWQLRPNISSTFQKFVLYSKHNIWAGRQWDWHYGVAKQYMLASLFVLLAAVNSWWWLMMVVLWLMARTTKRILIHRYEFGLLPLLNPAYFLGVMMIILVIDLATFVGWGEALLQKENDKSQKTVK